jgi:hypothetical protein
VYRLVESIERGRPGLQEAATELDEAIKATHPYPRWVASTASAGLAGALALLLGSPWVAVLVAFAVTAVIHPIGRFLAGRDAAGAGGRRRHHRAIGLALASGVTLGQFLTRPNATPLLCARAPSRGDRQ